MKKTGKVIGKIALWTGGIILSLLLLTWGGLNLLKIVLYSDYYAAKTDLCENPGLSDGFVCQGICAVEEKGVILVSGYMKDDAPSRIYITDPEDNARFVTLTYEGKAFDGHAGGIASHGDRVYVANGGAVYLLSLDTLLSAEAGSAVCLEEKVEVNNSASFCFADKDYLYVGEFHDGGKYVTDHLHTAPEGENHAIVSLYRHEDLSSPALIYSIGDKVQGFAVKDGKFLMSTSYGLTDSEYRLYSQESATDSGETLDGAPLYHFTSPEKVIEGPAMAEGISLWDGKFITLTESASDKYIFGKFFFATKIVSLEL